MTETTLSLTDDAECRTKTGIVDILPNLPWVDSSYRKESWFSDENYYPVYEKIAKILRPKSLLEVGSLQGFSLIAMLNGACGIERVAWMDNESYIRGSNGMCGQNVRFFLERWAPELRGLEIHHYTSRFELLSLSDSENPFDLIHIDGEHTFEGKLQDLLIADRLRPRYLMLDDYDHLLQVRQAIQYWSKSIRKGFFAINTLKGLAFFDFSEEQNAFNLLSEAGISCHADSSAFYSIAGQNGNNIRTCWCGGTLVGSVHHDYEKCSRCGTLVASGDVTSDELTERYTFDGYWHEYVSNELGYPSIEERAFTDLGDRIPVWHNLVSTYASNPKSILEIGCSYGGFLDYCRTEGIRDIVGVEVDEATCQFAKRRFRLPHVVSGLFPDIELPLKKFDVITGFDVLEHFRDPVGAVHEIKEHLNAGGIFIFQTPEYRGENDKWGQFKPVEHLFLFNKESVRLLFERNGLKILDILPAISFEDMFVIGMKPEEKKPPEAPEEVTDAGFVVPEQGQKSVQEALSQFNSGNQSAFVESLRRILAIPDLEAALKAASRLAVDYPDRPEIANFVAEANLQLQRPLLAKVILVDNLTRHQNDVDSLNDLALIETLQGNYETAAKIFDRIFEIDPANEIAKRNYDYLISSRKSGQGSAGEDDAIRSAEDTLREFLYANGNNTEVLIELAKLEMFDGRLFHARRLLGKVIEVDPLNPKCRQYLGALCERTVDYETERIISAFICR